MYSDIASARAGAAAANEPALQQRTPPPRKGARATFRSQAPAGTLTFRKRVFQTLEEPSSSALAKLIASVVLFFIILSVVAYIAGTLLEFTGPDGETGSCPLEDGTYQLGGYYTTPDGTPLLPLQACIPDGWPSPPQPPPPPAQPLPPPAEPPSEPVFVFFEPAKLQRVSLFGIVDDSDVDSDGEAGSPSDSLPDSPSPDPVYAPSTDALPPCAPCVWPSADFWACVELVCVMVFTVEYLARLLTCPAGRRGAWVVEPLNVVDVVAILPWYAEQIVGSASGNTQVVRALRLLRIFRISKASKKFALLHIFMRTMQRSWNPLGLTALLVAIACILFSSLVWFAERGEWDPESKQWLREDGSPSPFVDIPSTMWWCIVTFTTVGYGDMSPVTPWGQASGVLAMFAGLLVIALPSSVIGTNFEETFAERTLSERLEQQGLGSIEEVDEGTMRTEARLATSWDAKSPDGGLSIRDLEMVQHIFPRWEARARDMVLFTEQIGGLLHQLESTCEAVEAVCNRHAINSPAQSSAKHLQLPTSPRDIKGLAKRYSGSNVLGFAADDAGPAGAPAAVPADRRSKLLGDGD